MEKKEKKAEINFFKKVWYSITKFEQYPTLASEGFFRAIKYLAIMVVIVTLFSLINPISKTSKMVWDLSEYIENNVPDFTVSDGKLSMEIEEPIIIGQIENNSIQKIVVNPLADNDESKKQSEDEQTVEGITIFFFKDEIILNAKADSDKIRTQKYTYKEFISNYTKENEANFNKTELIDYMRSSQMNSFYASYALSSFIGLFITGFVYALLDVLRLSAFGWITAIIAKIKFKFVAVYNMAVYAFTLPMILEIIYILINSLTGFKIKYFSVAYTTIAYIYLATSIFILKDDLIKKMQEIMRIRKEQKNVREEIKKENEKKEPEEKPEDKEDEKENKKGEDGEEPQGSEA